MRETPQVMHDIARDLRELGAMNKILPEKPKVLTPGDIRAIRRKSGMSQTVFAAVINVSSNTIAKWEQGRCSPGGPSLRLLNAIDRNGIEAVI